MTVVAGAIGSRFKIDASYLSPNVNMAARLEAATKQYHVPLLISDSLHERLSPAVRARLFSEGLCSPATALPYLRLWFCFAVQACMRVG